MIVIEERMIAIHIRTSSDGHKELITNKVKIISSDESSLEQLD